MIKVFKPNKITCFECRGAHTWLKQEDNGTLQITLALL